jgi:hypothetical protein
MKQEKLMWIIVIGIVLFLVVQGGGLFTLFSTINPNPFSAELTSPDEVEFGGVAQFDFTTKLNGELIVPDSITAQMTLGTITEDLNVEGSNGLYKISFTPIKVGQASIKVNVAIGNESFEDAFLVKIKKPSLDITLIVPEQVTQKDSATIQALVSHGGDKINAESVSIEVVSPDNIKLEGKMVNTNIGEYEYKIKYEKDGIYFFKITPVIANFEVIPATEATTVIAKSGVDFYWIYLAFGFGLLLILMVRKRLKRG